MAAEKNNGEAAAAVFMGVKAQVVVPAGKAAEAVAFYKAALGAEEVRRETGPKRKAAASVAAGDGEDEREGEGEVVSAELKVGAAAFLVAEKDGGDDAVVREGQRGVVLLLETMEEDVDPMLEKVVAAGATKTEAKGDGDCVVMFVDPFNITWGMVTTSSSGAKKPHTDASADAAGANAEPEAEA